MKTAWPILFPAMIAGFCATAALAQEGDVVSWRLGVFEAGIVCAPTYIASNTAPGTVSGAVHHYDGDLAIISDDRRLPAVIGLGFGVRASLAYEGSSIVTITYTHPPMGEGGRTRQSYETTIGGAVSDVSFYHFDHDYELVTGEWTMTARSGKDILFHVAWEVVPPGDAPDYIGQCRGHQLS